MIVDNMIMILYLGWSLLHCTACSYSIAFRGFNDDYVVCGRYSHLLVSDFSDSVSTLPPDNLQNFVIDPRMIEMQNVGQVNPHRNEHAPRDVANRNALAVLLESMLPWVDYGRREDGEDHDEGHAQDNED